MSPPSPSAIFFDLDGTLVDSRRDIAAACNAARSSCGLEPLSLESIVAMVGDGARALIVRALGTTPNDPRVPGALDAYSSFYLNAPTAFTTRLPGVDELLARLDARCMPCAVVTNKPRGVSLCVLNNLEIARYFRAVWAGGDGPLKPSPAGLIHVATALGADVRDAWMVGDSPQDIEAGRAAGCFTIGVRGFAHAAALEASRPDVLVESLASLMTHV